MSSSALIVDDSLVARISIKGILKDRGLEINEASSGEAAFEKLKAGMRPGIVFLDLTMPGKGGLETLREIVAAYPAIPVVVVTADIQAKTVEQARTLGAAAIVRKPANRDEILSAMDRLLGAEQA
jgi:two-component system, chemotaxis family, chemotaxis protein CheY